MMIEYISGTLLRILANGAIVEVNSVGYGLELPLSQIGQLPNVGAPVSFWTYTHLREDAIRLFGFMQYEERLAFELLLGLNGVGPKLALAVLSTISLTDLTKAVMRAESTTLEGVPGVGKRMAEKILVELKPKLKRLGSITTVPRSGATTIEAFSNDGQDHLFEDLRSALENLGFREKAISPLVDRLKGGGTPASFPALMRRALAELSSNRAEDS